MRQRMMKRFDCVQEEKAQGIIRKVTNKRLVGNLQSLKAQGQLTLEKVQLFSKLPLTLTCAFASL